MKVNGGLALLSRFKHSATNYWVDELLTIEVPLDGEVGSLNTGSTTVQLKVVIGVDVAADFLLWRLS